MMILQFQITNMTEEENELIPDYCNWLSSIIFSTINTKINRKKISLRLNYLLDNVNWINWDKDKYTITVSEIMEAIYASIMFEKQKDNIYKIQINSNILIPHSSTSIDRLIRFINYGDNKVKATGMFTNLEREYNHNKLNSLWQMFIVKNNGSFSDAKIITR